MSRWQEQIVQNSYTDPEIFAGIDVGKHQLDIFVHPHGCTMRITNNAKAIHSLIRELGKLRSEAGRAGSDRQISYPRSYNVA